ncbi:Uu.00g033150.m01.CDS01 [Anthostomella pinea]|uniref:Uu.00g033150.m01.CDS01 n=1 Tax=Anthostomella pinea TaxID=933095 RepID=A0AAI8YD88_9PEZI|nr:Uu.00g033150.m01.CDS01 [Anthostomella pinea]
MFLTDNNGHIRTTELLAPENVTSNANPQVITEYLKRVQAVTWNRKFFEAETSGIGASDPLFGLGPPETQNDDRICILYGCSVPCILRPKANGNVLFQFIGEAYVHGRMDGEAIFTVSPDKLKTQKTTFCVI